MLLKAKYTEVPFHEQFHVFVHDITWKFSLELRHQIQEETAAVVQEHVIFYRKLGVLLRQG